MPKKLGEEVIYTRPGAGGQVSRRRRNSLLLLGFQSPPN